ncbi:MAG: hypothetical protein LBT59_29275, partial [Clostridiales bacterium]|nr:hypothetical protein [Clostridiales bacterium]
VVAASSKGRDKRHSQQNGYNPFHFFPPLDIKLYIRPVGASPAKPGAKALCAFCPLLIQRVKRRFSLSGVFQKAYKSLRHAFLAFARQ